MIPGCPPSLAQYEEAFGSGIVLGGLVVAVVFAVMGGVRYILNKPSA